MSIALSLVVPAFNESARLPRTLASIAAVLPRLADEVELVVVDDGSDDDTADLAESFAATAAMDASVRGRRADSLNAGTTRDSAMLIRRASRRGSARPCRRRPRRAGRRRCRSGR